MKHVILTCKNHLHLRWMCKSIAYSPGYGYNGSRNIFYLGTAPDPDPLDVTQYHVQEKECSCPGSDLVLAPGEKMPEDDAGRKD